MSQPREAAGDSPGAVTARGQRRPWLRPLIGLGVVAGLILLGRGAGAAIPAFAAWVDELGALGPLVFVSGYALAVVAFAPASVLTLAAGAVFGILEGTVYVFVAAMLGSCAAFLLARTVARASIETRIRDNPRFAAIDRAVGDEGRKIVFLLRLSPVFPFNLLNYALGLTRVRFADYAVAGIGMLPGTLLYVYSGSVAGTVVAAAGGAAAPRGAGYYTLLLGGLLATALVTVLVTRIARRALDVATS